MLDASALDPVTAGGNGTGRNTGKCTSESLSLRPTQGTPRLLAGVIRVYPVVHPPVCCSRQPCQYPRPMTRKQAAARVTVILASRQLKHQTASIQYRDSSSRFQLYQTSICIKLQATSAVTHSTVTATSSNKSPVSRGKWSCNFVPSRFQDFVFDVHPSRNEDSSCRGFYTQCLVTLLVQPLHIYLQERVDGSSAALLKVLLLYKVSS